MNWKNVLDLWVILAGMAIFVWWVSYGCEWHLNYTLNNKQRWILKGIALILASLAVGLR